MSNTPSVLSEGLVVDETYEVERLLGRGGMGEVWLARHRRLAGKQVAIKVLHTGGKTPHPDVLARFKREAEIAARLEHPHLVQVLDFNTLPTGEPYLVMEALKGEPLASRLRSGALPVPEVLAIVRQVGSALLAAHSAGVVHRDLKPDNIFLVPTSLGDQVKILDFGISKLADSSTVQTTDAVLIGTPLYMSPEQALGHNKDVTAQSDLFSLGSICYELLTGKAPFAAENIAKVVFRIAYEPHVPLLTVAPQVPPEVAQGVEHALVKDPKQRTTDIVSFVREVTGHTLGHQAPQPMRDVKSGVATPEMGLSASLAEGATITPTNGRLSQPAPVPPSAVSASAFAATAASTPLPVGGNALGPAPALASAAVAVAAPSTAVATAPPSPATQAGPPPGYEEWRRARLKRFKWAWMLIPLFFMGKSWLQRHVFTDDDGADEPSRPAHVKGGPRPPRTGKSAAPPTIADEGDAPDEAEAPEVVDGPNPPPPRAVTPTPAPPATPVPPAAPVVITAGQSGPPPVVTTPKLVAPRAPEEKPSADELLALADLQALFAAGKWDELSVTGKARQGAVTTAAGRQKVAETMLISACHRRDLGDANAQLNRLEAAGPAAMRAGKASCKKAWPDVGL